MFRPIIQIRKLSKIFCNTSGLSSWKKEEKHALKNVSVSIYKGEVFALVGESGSGKTTLGKCILKFIQPDSGQIIFDGVNLTQLKERNLKSVRKKIQMIFQNPQQALNPKQTVSSCILEVLKTHEKMSKDNTQKRLLELLTLVQLDESIILKYPFELSGGQQQRLVIARALSTRPNIIIADEPTSSLDAIIKLQIIDLFKKLQKNLNLTILFISHDLAIVSKIANRIGVMYKGEIVEQASKKDLLNNPFHPYTQLLLNSVKIEGLQTNNFNNQVTLKNNSKGCSFVDRCPKKQKLCFTTIPRLEELNSGHKVRCHFATHKTQKSLSEFSQLVGV
jgi:oligopeptide/dipeptide ABC transporter ATP-binding protein